MNTRSIAVALLVSLSPALVSVPRSAFAQSSDEASTKMARQRFQEGVTYFDKGQFELARASFLQAYALRKHPSILLNLAQSSLKSGHTLEAARYFQQFLKEHTAATDAQRADANRGLSDARMKLGRIDVIGATVGADIFVDDERIGMAPLDRSVDVEPGTHMVRSQGSGGEQTVQVTAPAGQGATARFTAPAPAAAPVAAAPTPAPEPAPEQPPPSAPPVEATPETPAPVPEAAPEEPSSGGPKTWVWVSGTVLAVAGVATAIVMGVEKSAAQNSADTLAQQILAAPNGGASACYGAQPKYGAACAALNNDDANVNADATIANIGIGVAIGATALTVLYVIVAQKHHGDPASPATAKANSLVLSPILGKGLSGLSFGASF